MVGIIRTPTKEERKDFIPLAGGGRIPEREFQDILSLKKLEAQKKGLPFCDKAAFDMWKDHYADEVKRIVREFGFADLTKVKQPKMDWSIYCNLDNFELVGEGEEYDAMESKKKGKPTFFQWKKYKYKGYNYHNTVMEPYPGAWNENTMSGVSNNKQKETKGNKK